MLTGLRLIPMELTYVIYICYCSFKARYGSTAYIIYLISSLQWWERQKILKKRLWYWKVRKKKKTHQNAFIHNSTFNLSNRKYVSSVKNEHVLLLIRNFFKVRYEGVCSKKLKLHWTCLMKCNWIVRNHPFFINMYHIIMWIKCIHYSKRKSLFYLNYTALYHLHYLHYLRLSLL